MEVQLRSHRSDTRTAVAAAVVVELEFDLALAFLDAFHSSPPVTFLALDFVIASARRYDSTKLSPATFAA